MFSLAVENAIVALCTARDRVSTYKYLKYPRTDWHNMIGRTTSRCKWLVLFRPLRRLARHSVVPRRGHSKQCSSSLTASSPQQRSLYSEQVLRNGQLSLVRNGQLSLVACNKLFLAASSPSLSIFFLYSSSNYVL